MSRHDDMERMRILRIIVLSIFVVIAARLFYLQLIDNKYKDMARNNVLRHVVVYPTRGEVYDRNGEYLVQSIEVYDFMVVYRELSPDGFDTLRLCETLGISAEKLVRELKNARCTPNIPHRITNFVSKEQKLRLDEYNLRGLYTVSRTARSYPRKIGGNVLGYVSEVTDQDLQRYPSYSKGDYIGVTGVEAAYESVLKGAKGLRIENRDVHGVSRGSYLDGAFDTLPQHGESIVCTIDARLQLFAEELMKGKVGAAVAIEPSTGEILMMVSSPSYDPDELVGRSRGTNYMNMLGDKRQPLFNRTVKSAYPPGSTFKLVQGLIGLQEGVLTPNTTYPCHSGYTSGRVTMKCHAHSSPVNLDQAVATSCNAYFCYVFRNILDNPKYGGVKNGYDVWREYVESFGFGHSLGSDFIGEKGGYVPDRQFYDKRYRGSWNSLTVLSMAIGQGELGCTPLQMANLAATIANRGYYYTPHIVRSISGSDSLNNRYTERHYTKVDAKHFETIIAGMWRGVNVSGTSLQARLDGYDVCGKTGTAQNPHGRDHSTFLSFAPRNNPRIAISVYVENGGFGAATALPIASLIEEFYLTGTVERTWLLDAVKNQKIDYPAYDKK